MQLPAYAELAPGVRRLLAPNPSIMTGPGTNTYLVGCAEIAVVDPGPAIDAHCTAIVEKAGAPIRYIVVTHTHPDHSPGAASLAARTGAQLIGLPPPATEHQDQTFIPTHIVADLEQLTARDFSLQFVFTPGHASNHICVLHKETNQLITGDHVIEGSTVVINPPDGNMADYLASLKKIRDLNVDAILPGHGDVIENPNEVIDWIIDHRLRREAKVAAALAANPDVSSRELVPHVYTDVAESLYGWAERSLLAHLEKLEFDGKASQAQGRWMPTSRAG